MNETLAFGFQLVGVVFTIFLIITIGILLGIFIIEKISELKYRYRYKHRFDKPPLAKCYCRDCEKFCENPYADTGTCIRFNIGVANTHFCREAEPVDYKHERKTRMKVRGENGASE